HRDAVAIGIGYQQVLAPERHTGRMQTSGYGGGDLERGQVDHGNSAGGHGARRILGDDRVTVGVFLEVVRSSNPSAFVRDVRGLAIPREHHAVWDVAD